MAKNQPWEYIPKSGRFKCVQCEYEHDDPGAVRLHAVKKHGWGRQDKTDQDTQGCKHSWRLLRASNPMEAQAIQAGYVRVCTKCEEVLQ